MSVTSWDNIILKADAVGLGLCLSAVPRRAGLRQAGIQRLRIFPNKDEPCRALGPRSSHPPPPVVTVPQHREDSPEGHRPSRGVEIPPVTVGVSICKG